MRVLLSGAVCVWLTMLPSAVLRAEHGQSTPPPQPASPTSTARAPGAVQATVVFGFIWNARNEPIAGALIRLRSVTTGKIENTTSAATNGQFVFQNVEGGTYLAEYVDKEGKILAVGQVFNVAPGETVATFIRLSSRPSSFAAFFGSAAAAVVAAAASIGVTAVVPPARPVSPEG